MDIWLEILRDIAISVMASAVMLKVTSWLAKKSHIKYFTIGESAIGDGSVIRGGWFSSAIISLAKWIQSVPD